VSVEKGLASLYNLAISTCSERATPPPDLSC
jgi:hypothetical protein